MADAYGGHVYSVVDLETTGLGLNDRVVEIAIVCLDKRLDEVGRYETLIDPQRGTGPVDIHGITPGMVADAPTFAEVIGDVAAILDGTILVAHNLKFDRRMLMQEFVRSGAKILPGRGLCTYHMSGNKLADACKRFGVALPNHHQAIADAIASAEILRQLPIHHAATPCEISGQHLRACGRTLRRDTQGRLIASDRFGRDETNDDEVASDQATPDEDRYYDVLQDSVIGGQLPHVAMKLISQTRRQLQLAADKALQVHQSFLRSYWEQAQEFGMMSRVVLQKLQMMATQLGVDLRDIADDYNPLTGQFFVDTTDTNNTKTGEDGQGDSRTHLNSPNDPDDLVLVRQGNPRADNSQSIKNHRPPPPTGTRYVETDLMARTPVFLTAQDVITIDDVVLPRSLLYVCNGGEESKFHSPYFDHSLVDLSLPVATMDAEDDAST
ncbi:MAG: 3'-5' exonuclease, partial [Planctomycetota bacterium]